MKCTRQKKSVECYKQEATRILEDSEKRNSISKCDGLIFSRSNWKREKDNGERHGKEKKEKWKSEDENIRDKTLFFLLPPSSLSLSSQSFFVSVILIIFLTISYCLKVSGKQAKQESSLSLHSIIEPPVPWAAIHFIACSNTLMCFVNRFDLRR